MSVSLFGFQILSGTKFKKSTMYQPKDLQSSDKLKWSAGRGVDVWQMFCECIAGNLAGVKPLVLCDASLVRCHYGYRTPLYFAVKENRLDVAQYLLAHSADPLAMEFGDSFVVQARDRGFEAMAALLNEHIAKNFAGPVRGALKVHANDPTWATPLEWAKR